ncbi:chemotaxis protein methyltransferase CheR [Mariprofundus aestuarium]|uniref:Chemotaxis protein methyltransferase CheR n=1 Tax=Mariprofundus aestuarium TaxID=1921086 RepID=A0A2K8L003_MARES|nr:CheR family methyltransferase [Mariprofundus aestuarium]ATX80598.1 chemotaxis protein methyltransferase CheR [Mariprofundus aestuarium]
MSLSVHDGGGKRRLLVMGELSIPEEQNELINAINDSAGMATEVAFFDARLLPGKLIKVLASHSSGVKPLRIRTHHPSLSHYLNKLKINSRNDLAISENKRHPTFKALALGGSADSLAKILHIIESLQLSELTVFIVQHVSEDQTNLLDKLLKMRTDYSVLMPHHMMPVEPGTIYIAPPGHQLRIHEQQVYLTRDRKVRFARPSIQVLFESLAYEYESSLMVALLCGYGDDGVEALKVLRDKGATVLIESPEECEAKNLPQNGIDSGHYDHVLSRKGIQSFFSSAAIKNSLPDLHTISSFLEAVREQYGYDFTEYQSGTLQRRIEVMLKSCGAADFFSLQRDVLTNPEAFDLLFSSLSINVTTFFRSPEQLDYLRQKVFPFLESFPHTKIWVAGCSSGEEAYSLAILLKEAGLLQRTTIYATDINSSILYEAKNGIYSCQKMDEYQDNYRLSGGARRFADYIEKQGDIFSIAPELRERVLFFRHSLVNEAVFNEFQLILCRNVIIYFSNKLQNHVMQLFSRSLHRDGFLTLGDKESLSLGDGNRYFKAENKEKKVYRWLS